ncbi:MAG: metal ABC transporter permease, partial [Actinomycetota bacterium]|nr:metal ABC transporter permease [Actinomycetota bacterium]
VTFATASSVGGILLALGSSIPISPYVTTISFLIYVVARIVGAVRQRRGWRQRPGAVRWPIGAEPVPHHP